MCAIFISHSSRSRFCLWVYGLANNAPFRTGWRLETPLSDLFRHFDLLFVTGGLSPTSDDITREITAELLGLKLLHNDEVMAAIRQRLRVRGIKLVDTISRQAMVPDGAEVLPNENGTAPGLYLPRNINPLLNRRIFFCCPVHHGSCSRCSRNRSSRA